MSHPIRPDHYIEINNFYTVTVYNKGAEVIRMMKTILGEENFRQAMDLYFTRNDGKAVTTEDFVQAMEDASGIDLTQFKRWYGEAGTPVLTIDDSYDMEKNEYHVMVEQNKDFHIPLSVGLLDEKGEDLLPEGTRVLNVKERKQTFTFENIEKAPLPSLLRDFSAPVKVQFAYDDEELAFLMQNDSNDFSRWDASSRLGVKHLLKMVDEQQHGRPMLLPQPYIDAMRAVVTNEQLDKVFIAEMLSLPTEDYLMEFLDVVHPHAIHTARKYAIELLAKSLVGELMHVYTTNLSNDAYQFSAELIGQRRLKNICLQYLTETGEQEFRHLAVDQFNRSDNLTDKIAAMAAVNSIDCPERQELLDAFYEQYQNNALVLDKWFALQAVAPMPGTFEKVQQLMGHPAFDIKNPNKVYSLIRMYAVANHVQFHDGSGESYKFIADQVLDIDQFNPQIAARLVDPLMRWKKFDEERGQKMRAQLERIQGVKKLSKNVYEVVSKSLEV